MFFIESASLQAINEANRGGVSSLIKSLIPSDVKQAYVYCEIEKSAYEIDYWCKNADGSWTNIGGLIEDDRVDPTEYEKVCDAVYKSIKSGKQFDPDARNVYTFIAKGSSISMQYKKYDKSVGLYPIKKEWKQKYIK